MSETSGDSAAVIAELRAEIAQLRSAQKAAAAEAVKKAADKVAADLAAAKKAAEEARGQLETERAERKAADIGRAVWDRMRSGAVKVGEGDSAKPVRVLDDRAMLGLFDLDGVELNEAGELPAGFDDKIRGWAESHPTRFVVGDPHTQRPQERPGTGGGRVPGAGIPRQPASDAVSEAAKLRGMARSYLVRTGVLPADGPQN